MDELYDRLIRDAAEIAGMEAPAGAGVLCRSVVEQTLRYCRRQDIPAGLEFIIAEMLAGRFKEAAGSDAVTSVKEGDTQVSFAARAVKRFEDYKPDLQCWRRVL